MSQDYIYDFVHGFERSQEQPQRHQIGRDPSTNKLIRVLGFDQQHAQPQPAPSSLVGLEEEESGGIPAVYEHAGVLSEMFNFPPGATPATASELLETQILNYHRTQHQRPSHVIDWYGGRQVGGVNESAAQAMQLFLINPPQSAPSQSPNSTLVFQNPVGTSITTAITSPSGPGQGHFGPSPNFAWAPPPPRGTTHESGSAESQRLSLSLSSSLQHLEAAKVEELRIGDDGGGMLCFNQGPELSGTAFQFPYKNLQLQTGEQRFPPTHPLHVAFASSSFSSNPLGVVSVLRNSKYAKAAQELLEEFCSVGRGQFKRTKLGSKHDPNNQDSNPDVSASSGAVGPSSSSSCKDLPPLSAADRIEHQRRKVKLLSMHDEVDRRYSHYCEQMQVVVNSYDMVMGFGAAVPYTALARKAMSRHFRCLKDAITAQLMHTCELLGEKDPGMSGVTKGETPRLRMLEQSLRQQRVFQQMGIMDQEAWRPQRGLPERSVNILRAWLFEHFLHPYPSDADKHLLSRQTGLSRNQVSNWFINARVRLWKPMVEEMYQQESKDEDDEEREKHAGGGVSSSSCGPSAQTPPPPAAASTAAPLLAAPGSEAIMAADKTFPINAPVNDPSTLTINSLRFSEPQAVVRQPPYFATVPADAANACGRGGVVGVDYGAGTADIGSALISLGAATGDVSLTLGLRHSATVPEKGGFSVRDFGGC